MGTKALKRAERQLSKREESQRQNERLRKSILPNKTVTPETLPPNEKKFLSSSVLISTLKIPRKNLPSNQGSRYHLPMSWCARKADIVGEWSWSNITEPRAWTDQEWEECIYPQMNNMEGSLWQELETDVTQQSA